MTHIRATLLLTLMGLGALTSCGDGGRLSTITGTVTVNGAPVDTGTIHFQSSESSKDSGGAIVSGGNFKLLSDDGFEPGEYTVVLQAFRETGRMINDPQKGKVKESKSIVLNEPSQKVTLGPDNAESLTLDYTAATK